MWLASHHMLPNNAVFGALRDKWEGRRAAHGGRLFIDRMLAEVDGEVRGMGGMFSFFFFLFFLIFLKLCLSALPSRSFYYIFISLSFFLYVLLTSACLLFLFAFRFF